MDQKFNHILLNGQLSNVTQLMSGYEWILNINAGWISNKGWMIMLFYIKCKNSQQNNSFLVLFLLLSFFARQLLFFPNALVGKIMHRIFTCKSFKIIDISIKILKVLLEEKPLISFVAKYDSYALGKQKEYQGN